MSQSDVLIFINVASWVFILFFAFYFFLYGKLLPSFYKNIRVQLIADIFIKRQFFNFFLNFLDKLFWYKTTFKTIYVNFSFLKNIKYFDFISLFKGDFNKFLWNRDTIKLGSF